MKNFIVPLLFDDIKILYADIDGVTIERVTVLNERVYIRMSSVPANRPDCSTNGGFHFSIPVNDDNGKATFIKW